MNDLSPVIAQLDKLNAELDGLNAELGAHLESLLAEIMRVNALCRQINTAREILASETKNEGKKGK